MAPSRKTRLGGWAWGPQVPSPESLPPLKTQRTLVYSYIIVPSHFPISLRAGCRMAQSENVEPVHFPLCLWGGCAARAKTGTVPGKGKQKRLSLSFLSVLTSCIKRNSQTCTVSLSVEVWGNDSGTNCKLKVKTAQDSKVDVSSRCPASGQAVPSTRSALRSPLNARGVCLPSVPPPPTAALLASSSPLIL